MKKTAISVALTALLMASAATVVAQDGGNTSQYDPNAASQLPEGIDPNAASQLPAGIDPNGASQLPDGVDPNGATDMRGNQLSPEMQGTIDRLSQQQQGSMQSGTDEASACEAILCLSTGGPPGECASSLRKYFSINLSKPWKTIQARINFLKLCPSADSDPQMSTLIDAIGNGAGRCDAASLNQSLRRWTGVDGEYEISNQMPSYCADYFSHRYTTDVNSMMPRYVDKYVSRTYVDSDGITRYEYAGGYWVDGQTAAPTAANDTNGAIPASRDPAAVGRY